VSVEELIADEGIAANNGILVLMDTSQPSNCDEVYSYRNQPRESASPSIDGYKEYLLDVETVGNEDTVKLSLCA
jgi:hypothetical protein